MEASVTGAGLILAVYALIIPMFHRIFEELNTELSDTSLEFEKLKIKITPESSTKEMKQLNELRSNIKALKKTPYYLFLGVVITFLLYFISTLYDVFWFTAISPESTGYVMSGIFISATAGFFYVGVVAIYIVYIPMKNEFERITKRQKVTETPL